jgi:4-amino-4-deoxy-L-arabinose transferase-like glycosyltransferase
MRYCTTDIVCLVFVEIVLLGGLIIALSADQLTGLLIAIALLFPLYFFARRSLKSQTLVWLAMLLFICISSVTLLNYWLNFYHLTPDGAFYDERGWAIAQELRRFETPTLDGPLGVKTYTFWVGLVYAIIGRSYFTMEVLNAFFLTLAYVNIASFSNYLGGKRVAAIALFLGLLHPAAYWYGSENLRESLLTLAMTLVLLEQLYALHQGRLPRAMPTLVGGVGATLLRPPVGLLVLPVIALAIGAKLLGFGSRTTPRVSSSWLAMFGIVIVLLPIVLPRISGEFVRYSTPENVYKTRLHRQGEGFVTYGTGQPDSWLDKVQLVPRAGFSFVFAPFPWKTEAWQYKGTAMNALWSGTISLLALLGLGRGSLGTRKRLVVVLLGVWCFIAVSAQGLIDTNFGAITRHQIAVIVFVVPLAAISLEHYLRPRRRLSGSVGRITHGEHLTASYAEGARS